MLSVFEEKSEDKVDFDDLKDLLDRNLAIINPVFEIAVDKWDFPANFFAIEFEEGKIKLDKLFLSGKYLFSMKEGLFANRMFFG